MKFVGGLTRVGPLAHSGEREGEAWGSTSAQEQTIAWHGRFRQPLFRYLRSLGLQDADGEEVIREVFLALFRHLLSDKPQQNLQAWLFTVARNQAMKRYGLRSEEVDLAWAVDAMDGRLNPEETCLQAQQGRRIAAVVRALPEQDRECLVLRSEGLGYRDIASMQSRSVGAVVLAVKRSLAKIAEVSGR